MGEQDYKFDGPEEAKRRAEALDVASFPGIATGTTGDTVWLRKELTSGGLWNAGEYCHTPIPADGDNYAYTPPQIPPQWVPVTEYRELLRRVEALERQVAALAKGDA